MINKSSSIALDTTAYSHLVRGNKEMAALLTGAGTIVVPHHTVAELKSGFAFGSRQQENEAKLTRFLAADRVMLVYPNEVTTDYYVALFSHARRSGRQLSHNDLWIAALALQHQAELCSFDQDFAALASFDGFRLHQLRPGI